MKKTISINIGGNIFHIEEEGYEKLKDYLDSVHQYFSGFEDSKEIIDDIENRIAEKFYSQLKKNKEAVTAKEVDELITSMGTVADFEATLDEEPQDQKQKHSTTKDSNKEEGAKEPRRLYRDTRRSILGGVSAGIAHYFSIDPIWIRLLWILLLSTGVTVIAYPILWIVLPGNSDLEESKSVKKLYRNPDQRVFGGVCGGIASYFGIDPVVVRLIFIITFFLSGAGLILYIILWIITPEANTVTEKMEMSGEPVTLSGIEKNLKKSLKIDQTEEENVFVKILLFPFRLVAWVFEGIGRALGPLSVFLIEAIRILFGAGLVIAAFGVMIAQISILLAMLGAFYEWPNYAGEIDGIPLRIFIDNLGPLASFSTFFLGFIPALGIALLGLSIILKKRVGNAYLAVAMLGIWLLALIGVSFTIPQQFAKFRSNDSITREMDFEKTDVVPTLDINDAGLEDGRRVDLRLRGHSDSTYRMVLNIESRGKTREDARYYAEQMEYEVTFSDDKILFDNRLTLDDLNDFRFQHAEGVFYIPFGQEFYMDDDLAEILVNTLHLNGYRRWEMEGNRWVFDENGINCLTCEVDTLRTPGFSSVDATGEYYEVSYFDEIEVSSAFEVIVYPSDKPEVRIDASKKDLRRVQLRERDDRLYIDYESRRFLNRRDDRIKVFIGTSELKYFESDGACKGVIRDFEGDELEIVLDGASDFDLDLDYVERLEVNTSGGANLNVRGKADRLYVYAAGASRFSGKDLESNYATIDAKGASKVWVRASEELEIEASGVSRVVHSGTYDVSIDEEGASRVSRD